MSLSEREAVLRERKAYLLNCSVSWNGEGCADCVRNAAEIFPLPKVTRPRVVRDPEPGFDQEWRWVGGNLQWRVSAKLNGPKASEWYLVEETSDLSSTSNTIRKVTPKRLAIWSDLAARPVECVEDDGQ